MTSESKLAPPVVAVLVTDGLGAWFEEALDAVREQDYGNLRVVVVDRGQHRVGEQVLSKIPEAVVREAASSKGFGEAANTVQSVVEGAAFYLFLREDAVLAPDAVTRLVDEALESNAGILGPKVLDWNDPTRLVSMGCLVDAFGVETPFVESGELDQQQHDRVREAFTVTGEAVLVRCDLFRTIGGFDPRITSGEQYLDLCWRAQIAGGRVLVVPNATVRAQSAMVETPPENLRRSQMRHRHHVMAKCYGWMHLVPIMVMQVVGAGLALAMVGEGTVDAAGLTDIVAGVDGAADTGGDEIVTMWAFDLWPMLMMVAAGALIGAIASRCDGWMTAFAVVAMAGALGAGVTGADTMAAEVMGSGNMVEAASNWVLDGVVIGVGALLGGMLEDQL